MFKRLFLFFAAPINLSILNAVLIMLAILGNIYFQVYCFPVTWVIIVLSICLLNIILTPILINKKQITPIISFINGIGFSIFIYCVLFLEHINYWSVLLILFGVGIFIFILYFFIIQYIKTHLFGSISSISKLTFLAGILLSMSSIFIIHHQFSKAVTEIETFVDNDFEALEQTYLTERILGMHFLYHTRICEFDGWRPPLHDPILNIGLWLNGREDPLKIDLDKRIELYQKFYPKNPIKLDCSCAIMYSENYHNDELFKK